MNISNAGQYLSVNKNNNIVLIEIYIFRGHHTLDKILSIGPFNELFYIYSRWIEFISQLVLFFLIINIGISLPSYQKKFLLFITIFPKVGDEAQKR